jgi:hypothetical protein
MTVTAFSAQNNVVASYTSDQTWDRVLTDAEYYAFTWNEDETRDALVISHVIVASSTGARKRINVSYQPALAEVSA